MRDHGQGSEGAPDRQRVLLFSHTTGYQLRAFNDAAAALGIELVFATDRCHRLDDPWQDRAVPVRFHALDASVSAIRRASAQRSVRGVIAVGDRPVPLAARAAAALGLEWHTIDGADASTDKRRARAAFSAAGLPSPRSALIAAGATSTSSPVGYPCVLKPLYLSASRGVIRADDDAAFTRALARIQALLARPPIRAARVGLGNDVLVETYIEGEEFAIEGVMTRGRLQPFAIFDKPDPLVGPYFEETIYVTPSRLPDDRQRAIVAAIETGARALGLVHGPVHGECRVSPDSAVYVLEIAARPIGGLCSRVLSFAGAQGPESLEHVLLRHAVGEDVSAAPRDARGAAVMMIPIPRRGIFKGVSGVDAARAVPGITEIHITAKPDQLLETLPESGSYLGFIFARAGSAAAAEQAVRAAHAALIFEIAREIAVAAKS